MKTTPGRGSASTPQSDNPPPTATDVQGLIEAVHSGYEALGRLLDLYRPYLVKIGNEELPADLRGKGGASDVVQDVFYKMLKSFGGFRGHTEPELREWLRVAFLNTLRNFERGFRDTEKRGGVGEEPLGDGSFNAPPATTPSPKSEAIGRERDERLLAAMSELAEVDQMVLRLRFWLRLPFEEIGVAMGIAPDAARMRVNAARQRLSEVPGIAGLADGES